MDGFRRLGNNEYGNYKWASFCFEQIFLRLFMSSGRLGDGGRDQGVAVQGRVEC